MKKLLYSFLILSSATVFAQSSAVKFAVADNAIGTVDMFNARKSVMQVLKVYNSAASLPQNLKKYSSVFTKGVTEYKFKNGQNVLDRISLADLNTQNNIPGDTPVFIEGHEFTDTSTLVYGELLAKVESKDHNGKKTLFISASR